MSNANFIFSDNTGELYNLYKEYFNSHLCCNCVYVSLNNNRAVFFKKQSALTCSPQ